MPTIKGNEIESLIELFKARNVKLFHACQLVDFKTYLEIGGIPSRNLMEHSESSYTAFDTDETDKNNEVWNKVFLNLSDFGFSFAKGQRKENTAPIPNPYGPILFVYNPEILNEATDIALCLRSAGAHNFNRNSESLGSLEEINKIFEHNIDSAPNDYAKAYVKFSNKLQESFPTHQVKSPEISCIVEEEHLSFDNLHHILVDGYKISGKKLSNVARKLKNEFRVTAPVWDRFYNSGRQEVKQELADLLMEKIMKIDEILQMENISEELRDYTNRLKKGNMDFQFDRFASYLHLGTLLEISKED